jgi:hypothetical protein
MVTGVTRRSWPPSHRRKAQTSSDRRVASHGREPL